MSQFRVWPFLPAAIAAFGERNRNPGRHFAGDYGIMDLIGKSDFRTKFYPAKLKSTSHIICGVMAETQEDGYSIHFAHYAGKLEQHLRKNGISCRDADMIIEESSELYFEKIHSSENKFVRLLKKGDPAQLFAESAARAIELHLPEAKNTFGSYGEIIKCIR
jgi:hypothetical protein